MLSAVFLHKKRYLEKFLFLRYGPKCSPTNQIVGFVNQAYLKNKSMKWPVFLQVDTNSHKLKINQKFLGGLCQKWMWPVWLRYSKIDCISRMN